MPWPKRLASAAALVVAALVLALVAYQLALARIPEHRATLERIVRAQTGLDVRFEELGVRWGWYGPEAVFHRVELGEPGRSRVLVRAPELMVGVDAWATLHSGQLKAGRIVLVAPDIDLHRGPVGREALGAGANARAEPAGDAAVALRLLQRWENGRVELEDGTVRIADPAVPGRSLTLLVRRAWLRRTGAEWSIDAAMRLPDRLGRTLRLVAQVQGALDRPATLQGTLRLEGNRLEFAGWRSWADADPWLARLPLAGSGDLTARLVLRDGRIASGSGEILADGVAFAPATGTSRLRVGFVGTDWTLARRGADWQLDARRLRIGPDGRNAPPTQATLAVAPAGGYARLTVARLPAAVVAAIAASWTGVELGRLQPGGSAREVSLAWNAARPAGSRLALGAVVDDLALAGPDGIAIEGLAARIEGSESALVIDLQAAAARVQLAAPPVEPLQDVQLATRLHLVSGAHGWTLSTDRLAIVHPAAAFSLSGRLAAAVPIDAAAPAAAAMPAMAASPAVAAADDAAPPPRPALAAPVLRLEGHIQRGDVATVRSLLATQQAPGVAGQFARLTAGRIVAGRFAFDGSLAPDSAAPLRGFSGSLQIEDAEIEGEGAWPALAGAAGRIEWKGPQLHATLTRGTGSGLQIAALRADWRAGEPGLLRASGRATGRVEDALAWLRDHPELAASVPPLQELDARGNAVIDFDVPPAGTRGRAAPARITAFVDRVSVATAGTLPPLQDLRGTLVFDGALRRSTLTGTWLGGPVTLRVGETRGAGVAAGTGGNAGGGASASAAEGGALALQAQGWLGPDRLAGLARLDPALRREGSTPWQGSLEFAAASAARPAAGVLHLSVNDRLRAVLDVQHGESGWKLVRGAARFGGPAPELPSQPALLVSGRIERLDLGAWLESWRGAGTAVLPPVRATLDVGALALAGHDFEDVALTARRGGPDDAIELDSRDLAGTVRLGTTPAIDVQLERLHLASADDAGDVRRALAALGPSARIGVDELTWNDRLLGRLAANVTAEDGRLQLDDLVLASPARELRASATCDGAASPCRIELDVKGRDAAAVLRDVGLDLDARADAVAVQGELRWQPASGRPWYAAMDGELAVQLGAGRVVPPGPGNAGPLEFERLAGTLRLRDGQLSSDDLHLDGPTEILVRGRAGLVTRDYDFLAWVLRGEERLPAAVRRFAATPRVAAAWLSLRDFLEPGGADRARAVLQVRGSWDDPVVERASRAARDEPPQTSEP